MRNLRPAAFLLPVFLLVSAVPVHAAAYRIKWLLGHPNLDYFEEAARAFKDTVEKESGGEIAVEIVPAEQEALGDVAQAKDPEAIAAKVAKGEAEMGHSFANVLSAVEPRMQVFESPYLFRGYRHLEGVFEGPAGGRLLDTLKSHGIIGLSFTYSGGANGVATQDRELRSPADLKGLRVGVYGDDVDTAWLKQAGAVPITLRHDRRRIVPLAQEGKLDAVLITWRNFERASLARTFGRFNLAGASYLVSVTYVNQKFYESLPEKYRELLARAARESGRIERAQTIELNEMSKREMLARGVLPVYLGGKDLARFTAALAPAYDGPIARAVGKDLLEDLRKVPDAPVAPVLPRSLELVRR